jgi:hypothetical protein
MEILCNHLGENYLQTFESVRATYLMKVLRVSRFALALVYVLARENLLLLSYTNAVNNLLIEGRKKDNEMCESFAADFKRMHGLIYKENRNDIVLQNIS